MLLSASDLNRKVVASLMEDMLRGLHYLHSKGIFHRDIKLDNIMLRKEGKDYRPVIIDLGMAHYTNNSEYLFDKCGSPGYVAPEVFTQGAKDPKGDVFSLGVIFYILYNFFYLDCSKKPSLMELHAKRSFLTIEMPISTLIMIGSTKKMISSKIYC